MLKILKNWLEAIKRYNDTLFENKSLKSQIQGLEVALKDPKEVLKAVLSREIKWIDFDELDYPNKKRWVNAVEDLKQNAVFRSLFGYQDLYNEKVNGLLVKNLLEAGLIESQNWQQVRDVQMTINGIELIWKYLDDMIDPDMNKRDSNIED